MGLKIIPFCNDPYPDLEKKLKILDDKEITLEIILSLFLGL